jgi:hypothetical protein
MARCLTKEMVEVWLGMRRSMCLKKAKIRP